METSVNKEGLTFEEWVCAAGKAVRDPLFSEFCVAPYTRSGVTYPDHKDYGIKPGRCSTDPRPPKRYTNRYYSEKIRQAWKQGEDPTEWRA